MKLAFVLGLLLQSFHDGTCQSYTAPCSSEFYCKGDILDKVQMSKAFALQNMFVDMPMKNVSALAAQQLADELKNISSSSATDIKEVIQKYFAQPGIELSVAVPRDWTVKPKFLQKIKDPLLQNWAKIINEEWKKLTRKVKMAVKTNPSQYSLLYSEKAFVLPGEGYREFNYWNSYWTLNGLLLCNMKSTARGMIENFIELVKTYGYVPSGDRVYYLNRSQPPFLTLMVLEYWQATNDTAFLQQVLPYLEKEYDFWMTNRSVTLDASHGFKSPVALNQYSTNMGYPRPESYWNDVETAQKAGVYQNETNRQKLFSHIASAAESGWDFSSRWLALSGKDAMKMESIKTRDIVPVDLNAILCKVEQSLGNLYQTTGDSVKSKQFQMAYRKRTKAISDAFWDEERGQWLDFDIETKKHRSPFYVSNISPIWADCFDGNKTRASKAIESIKKQGVFDYPGGVPTSLNNSGYFWDFPNAWPPLQDMLEIALRNAGYNDLAYTTAKKWIEVNYLSWVQRGHMHEKFNVSVKGKPGYGDHGSMVRFSWTNGVVLKFLDRYGDRVKSIPKDWRKPPKSASFAPKVSRFLAIVAFGYIYAFLAIIA